MARNRLFDDDVIVIGMGRFGSAVALELTRLGHRVIAVERNNQLAESFVNTFKRDYVGRMDLSNASTVLEQLPAAFEHFNEIHSHSSLKMKSPREFRRQRVEQLRRAQIKKPALHCV